jgi:cytochrome P450
VIQLGPEYFQDPHAVHRRLREQGPVVPVVLPDGLRAWLVTGYDEVRAALADPRLYKDRRRKGWEEDSAPERVLFRHMLNSDPPDHERLRRLVSKAFTARRVERLRPRIAEITESLLSALAGRTEADLLAEFAFPLPITVICELLGLPAADRDEFRSWSAGVVSGTDSRLAGIQAAAAAWTGYVSGLLAARRAAPADDLLSALVQARDGDDQLTDPELLATVFLLLLAGHETTVNLIASGVLALLLDPAQLARLAADRSLLPAAIEELLRYTSPVNLATLRFAAEPVRIGDTEIPARAVVLLALSAANRDESRFSVPDGLDLGRDAGGHVAFGHGIHYCLGAQLARVEAEIALGALLDRYPGMTLAVPATELRWRPSTLIRGLETLRVRLTPG